MKQAEIEQEKNRLAKLVFEGSPDWFDWAVYDCEQGWLLNANKPIQNVAFWSAPTMFTRCKNQPETKLDWSQTLLRRSDYE